MCLGLFSVPDENIGLQNLYSVITLVYLNSNYSMTIEAK